MLRAREGEGEDLLFRLLAWFLRVYTAVILVVGTTVLSSMLLISMIDAMGIVGRCMLCTTVCRLVVVRESMRAQKIGIRLVGQNKKADPEVAHLLG